MILGFHHSAGSGEKSFWHLQDLVLRLRLSCQIEQWWTCRRIPARPGVWPKLPPDAVLSALPSEVPGYSSHQQVQSGISLTHLPQACPPSWWLTLHITRPLQLSSEMWPGPTPGLTLTSLQADNSVPAWAWYGADQGTRYVEEAWLHAELELSSSEHQILWRRGLARGLRGRPSVPEWGRGARPRKQKPRLTLPSDLLYTPYYASSSVW